MVVKIKNKSLEAKRHINTLAAIFELNYFCFINSPVEIASANILY